MGVRAGLTVRIDAGTVVLDEGGHGVQLPSASDRKNGDAAAAVIGDECVFALGVDLDIAGPAPPAGWELSRVNFPSAGID